MLLLQSFSLFRLVVKPRTPAAVRGQPLSTNGPAARIIHYGGEGVHLQACSSYQSSINFFLRHKSDDVIRLDAATVKDSQPGSHNTTETPGR
jgi:hypothetical protein